MHLFLDRCKLLKAQWLSTKNKVYQDEGKALIGVLYEYVESDNYSYLPYNNHYSLEFLKPFLDVFDFEDY